MILIGNTSIIIRVEGTSELTRVIIISSMELTGTDLCMALKVSLNNSESQYFLNKIRIFSTNSSPNLFNSHWTPSTDLFLLTTQTSTDKNKTLLLISLE